MNTLKQLRDAKELILDPANWSRNHIASNKSGNEVEVFDEDAISFDMIGSLRKVSGPDKDTKPAIKLLREHSCGKDGSIFEFNMNSSHETVLAAFDNAIIAVQTETVK